MGNVATIETSQNAPVSAQKGSKSNATPSVAIGGYQKPEKTRLAKIRDFRLNPNPPAEKANLAAILRKWTQTPTQQAAIRARLAALPKGSVLGWKGDKLEWQVPTTEKISTVAARVDTRKPDPVAAGERTSGLVAVGYVDNDGVKITKGRLS